MSNKSSQPRVVLAPSSVKHRDTLRYHPSGKAKSVPEGMQNVLELQLVVTDEAAQPPYMPPNLNHSVDPRANGFGSPPAHLPGHPLTGHGGANSYGHGAAPNHPHRELDQFSDPLVSHPAYVNPATAPLAYYHQPLRALHVAHALHSANGHQGTQFHIGGEDVAANPPVASSSTNYSNPLGYPPTAHPEYAHYGANHQREPSGPHHRL